MVGKLCQLPTSIVLLLAHSCSRPCLYQPGHSKRQCSFCFVASCSCTQELAVPVPILNEALVSHPTVLASARSRQPILPAPAGTCTCTNPKVHVQNSCLYLRLLHLQAGAAADAGASADSQRDIDITPDWVGLSKKQAAKPPGTHRHLQTHNSKSPCATSCLHLRPLQAQAGAAGAPDSGGDGAHRLRTRGGASG